MPLNCNVRLMRGKLDTPWGLTLHGGKEFNQQFTVLKVTPGSVAQSAGVKQGDVVVKIANKPTADMEHDEAMELIQNAQNHLVLTILK